MQAMIMAAGSGLRLGELTAEQPKALVRVAGRSLIDHALAFARQVGTDHRVVVGGFCFTDLRAEAHTAAPTAAVLENADHGKGNLLSLQVDEPHERDRAEQGRARG